MSQQLSIDIYIAEVIMAITKLNTPFAHLPIILNNGHLITDPTIILNNTYHKARVIFLPFMNACLPAAFTTAGSVAGAPGLQTMSTLTVPAKISGISTVRIACNIFFKLCQTSTLLVNR